VPEVILKATDLVKHYPIKGGILRRTVGHVKAVDGVSFELLKGETLGVVGESGCGKSTLGRLLMRLEEPTSGSVEFEGRDMHKQSSSDMRRMRRDIQIVFQDPYTSLNPRKTVGDIIGEPFEIHPDAVPKGGRRRAVQELLEKVGLNPEHINRFPHQFSGGQRQRIGIARGIALNPKVLICDEPVSALDVSVQAQVVNLMEKLQNELGLSYVFIAHDLSVVRHISDRVAVMYLGKIAELGEEDEVYDRPTHPYTQALLSAVPVPDPTLRGKREQIVLTGDVPSPANPPAGCRFHTRCWRAQDLCKTEVPPLEPRPDGVGAHLSACHFAEVRAIIETARADNSGLIFDKGISDPAAPSDSVDSGAPVGAGAERTSLATADIADAGVDALRAGPIDHQVADQAQTVIRESDTPRA
jgi:oligopeptide transport system ATP-binding protein